tara:strand:- start:5217 stop:7337 length:2121 start_codon:yes stop_codon:yes gene_type:complete
MNSLKNISDEVSKKVVWYNVQDNYTDLFSELFKNSSDHKMGVGYFSSAWVSLNADGISHFVKNKGQATWLISPRINENDPLLIDYINYSEEDKNKFCQEVIVSNVEELKKNLQSSSSFFSTLAGMIQNDSLIIKVAKPKVFGKHIHIKLHEFNDDYGNTILLHGSSNPTENGMDHSYEELTQYQSWNDSHMEFISPHSNRLDALLTDGEQGVYEIIDLDEAIKKKLIVRLKADDFKNNNQKNPNQEIDEPLSMNFIIPNKYLTHKGFNDIQNKALSEAKKRNYSALLEMATGTGKTIASIKIFHEFLTQYKNEKCLLVVTCPTDILVNQWNDVLNECNISPKIYTKSGRKENGEIKSFLSDVNSGYMENIEAIIIIDDSLKDAEIQEYLKELSIKKSLFLIIDEVHNITSPTYSTIKLKLLDNIDYKIGLTATAEKDYKPLNGKSSGQQQEQLIIELFGPNSFVKIVDIGEAITKYKVLCEYDYEPIPFVLSLEETEKLFGFYKTALKSLSSTSDDYEANERTAHFKLGREIARVSSKFLEFEKYVTKQIAEDLKKSNTLIYVPNDRIERVAQHLRKFNIDSMKITQDVPKDKRQIILNEFKDGRVHTLIAIRILDEGLNIPEVNIAFFMESYKEPRQWVQRRGRILRNPEKKNAKIIDFIVKISPEFSITDDLGKKINYAKAFVDYLEDYDKNRMETFRRDSRNK